jgi:DNA repair protein SbcD/Mre11
VKLAHLADLHLGFRQYYRHTDRGINQREADVNDAFHRAVDDLIVQRPDLIVVAGDLFHSIRPTNYTIYAALQEFTRLRQALPATPIVAISGNHDTPRSVETGNVLKLFDLIGIQAVSEQAKWLRFEQLGCAVLAVPHQALVSGAPPPLKVEPDPAYPVSILVIHGEVEGLFPDRDALELGGAYLKHDYLDPGAWTYVALGHYHVARAVARNAWYCGSLEYVSPNPWGELREEESQRQEGKRYLMVDLPSGRVEHRPIAANRQLLDLSAINGRDLDARALDAAIAQRVREARPGIADNVVRLVVRDVPRHVARDLDHVALRAYRSSALYFHLDLRRPERQRTVGAGAPGRRQPLSELLDDFLRRRPLDADLDRDAFVQLGQDLLAAVDRAEAES